jgi:hypothetical protein
VGLSEGCGHEMGWRRWDGDGLGDGEGGGVIGMINKRGRKQETGRSGLKLVLWEDIMGQSKGWIGVGGESI